MYYYMNASFLKKKEISGKISLFSCAIKWYTTGINSIFLKSVSKGMLFRNDNKAGGMLYE